MLPLIAISARKHGIHDHEMIHAFNHPILQRRPDHH
jgi:hypothetical protein